jgi:exodeoxyribonuclease-3
MKLISWNVNGLRACVNKGFLDFYKNIDADIFCIQETKMQENQVDLQIKNLVPNVYFNSAEKKGYSGTAVFAKETPINVFYGIHPKIAKNIRQDLYNLKATEYLDDLKSLNKTLNEDEKEALGDSKINFSSADEIALLTEKDNEGRILTLEYDKFFLVNCYVPNSKRALERLNYRAVWEDEMKEYLKELDKIKPVIYCGDLNVAHEEIDLKNPSSNHNNAGFTDIERNKMSLLLNSGFVDSFRYIYPDKEGEYSWWSYMFHARENNAGWRIDYFIVSDRIKDKIQDAKIHQEVFGSDHCPIELDIKL